MIKVSVEFQIHLRLMWSRGCGCKTVVRFIALRLEDEPLTEMSVALEGTARCFPVCCSLQCCIYCVPLLTACSSEEFIIIVLVLLSANASSGK